MAIVLLEKKLRALGVRPAPPAPEGKGTEK